MLFVYSVTIEVDQEQEQAFEQDLKTDPISKYLVECLRTISKDAIIEMSQHGGYTNLERNNIKISSDALNSEAVLFSPSQQYVEDPFAIPYYFYMTSPTGCRQNCEFSVRMPELYREEGSPSIETELDYFVEENLEICLNDFEEFTQKGFTIIELGEPNVESNINLNDIGFELEYPLKVTTLNESYEISQFFIKHDVDFIEFYKLAKELTESQQEYRYLERQLLNLISVYGGVDSNIPPMVDSTFVFGDPGNTWVKSNVQTQVQEIAKTYVNRLKATNSVNYKEVGRNQLERKILDDQMRIELSEVYDLEVSFSYLDWWPFYFDLNCDGERCAPESFSNLFFILIGNQRYNFFYSFSYPVLVKIYDRSAFKGEGLNMYFFLETNAVNNDPLLPGEINYDFSTSLSSLVCNPNQRNTGNYTLSAVNRITKEPVQDVSMYFTCLSQTCTIDTAPEGKFSATLPICAGGSISLVNKDYLTTAIPVSTALDKKDDLGFVELEPLISREFEVKKLKLTKYFEDTWTPNGYGTLQPKEEAVVILRREIPGQREYIQTARLNGEYKTTNLTLPPGEYQIQVILTDKEELIIPEDIIEVDTGFSSKKVTIPGLEFNESTPFVLGGLEGNFTITTEVDSAQKIILNVVSFELSEMLENERSLEDIQIMAKVPDYSKEYSSQLGFRYER